MKQINKEKKKLTYCNYNTVKGCGKMTESILSDDRTHYYCKECGAIK